MVVGKRRERGEKKKMNVWEIALDFILFFFPTTAKTFKQLLADFYGKVNGARFSGCENFFFRGATRMEMMRAICVMSFYGKKKTSRGFFFAKKW